MRDPGPSSSGDVPTVLVRDREGHDLLCFLEQRLPLDGEEGVAGQGQHNPPKGYKILLKNKYLSQSKLIYTSGVDRI